MATIQDPQIKTAFLPLFNIIEDLNSRNKTLMEENLSLRDKINRLKGEHGKPDIKPNKIADIGNISSEKESNKKKN